MKLSICFHHTQQDFKIWEDFAHYLSEKLHENIEIVKFDSFLEEKEQMKSNDYELVFQNPEIILTLSERGYIPIGRLADQWDVVYYIAAKDFEINKDIYRIGIVPLRVIFSTVFDLEKIGVNIGDFDFIYEKNLENIHKKILNKELDIGITRQDSFERMPDDIKSQFKILTEFSMGIFHAFMINPSIKHRENEIKEILYTMHEDPKGNEILKTLQSKKIVEVGYEIFFLERFTELGDKLLEYRSLKSLSNSVNNAPNIGMIIYRDKIKYANNFAKNFMGYSADELEHVDLMDFFEGVTREKLEEDFNKRLKGFNHEDLYENIPIVNKNKYKKHIVASTSTVVFDGEFSVLITFLDITRRETLENLFYTLKEINHLIIGAISEEELFRGVCEILAKRLGFDLVWIGKSDGNKDIIPEYIFKDKSDITNEVDLEISNHCCELKHPYEAFEKSEIYINSDISTNSDMAISKKESPTNNYLSSCFVPVLKDGKPYASLNIFSKQPYFFDQDMYHLLVELKDDLSFAMDKIEKEKKALIFFESIRNSKGWFLITDANGVITYVNEAVCDISGYTKDEIIGSKPNIFKSKYHNRDFYKNLWDTITNGQNFSSIIINRKKNGELLYLDALITPVVMNNEILRYVNVGKDVTKETSLENEKEMLKYYDPVTHAYNYSGFKFSASQLFELAKDRKSHIYLIIVDIYNMSYVNVLFGIDAGDYLLSYVVEALYDIIGNKDIIGRIGGDDFGVLLNDVKSEGDLLAYIDNILNTFRNPVNIKGSEVKANINLGIAKYPEDAKDISILLDRANLALTHSKKAGENSVEFYNEDFEKSALNYFYMDELLSGAVPEERYVLYYQPYFNISSNSIAGYEALVRLKDRDNNMISPGKFIDYLENSRFLEEFEDWLIDKALSTIRRYNTNISINISSRNLKKESVFKKLYKSPPELTCKLTIEITERGMLANLDKYKMKFEALKRDTGVKLSIDDFGTGYSSLSRLKEIPADILKIDKSFIKDMANAKKDENFVAAIVDLSKKFGFVPLAEGVETESQLENLKTMGCDMMQGFLLGKPADEAKSLGRV